MALCILWVEMVLAVFSLWWWWWLLVSVTPDGSDFVTEEGIEILFAGGDVLQIMEQLSG